MTWIDIVLLVLLVHAALSGYRRGFLSILAGVLGLIVGVVTAYNYYQPVAEALNRDYHAAYYLQSIFLDKLSWSSTAAKVSTAVFPADYYPSVVQDLPVPDYFQQFLLQTLSAPAVTSKVPSTVGGLLSLALSHLLLKVLVFIGIALLVKVAASVAASLFSRLADGSLFDGMNRLIGLGLNLTTRVLVLALVCGLLVPVFTLTGQSAAAGEKSLSATVTGSWLVPRLEALFTVLWQTLLAGKGLPT
ncbi:MAG: CvpA family protein [Firmicutes bacterium]|nr:CvpA family protein [Bacillota bacterium]